MMEGLTDQVVPRPAPLTGLAEIMRRDNTSWVTDLMADGPRQQEALIDLRRILLRGLRKALSQRPLPDESLLEDAAQEALVRILSRLDQFEGRSRFLTWATSIAIRVAMSELRRKRWKDTSLDETVGDTDLVPELAVDPSPGPESHWQRRAIVEQMNRLISVRLTQKQRIALLAELKGMPQDEIARHLCSNRNAVYKLTHDARRRLRQGLEEAGYGAADVRSAFYA